MCMQESIFKRVFLTVCVREPLLDHVTSLCVTQIEVTLQCVLIKPG
jgi:hypothetical protein